jgi:RNase P subunit RPR2
MAAPSGRLCKRCRHEMVTVTNVAPNGRDPGLVVWYCEQCGAADSDLVYSSNGPPSLLRLHHFR